MIHLMSVILRTYVQIRPVFVDLAHTYRKNFGDPKYVASMSKNLAMYVA